jgi:DNA-binding transcriptional regulator YhcF (GntR family)
MWSNLMLLLILIKISISPKINELRATITEQDQRAFIKCHVLLGDSPQEIYHMLKKIARRNTSAQKTVYNLYNEFTSGSRSSTGDTGRRPGSGRPRTQATPENREKLKNLIIEDDEITVREMAKSLSVSTYVVEKLLKELGAKKVSARYVPHALTCDQKQSRKEICQEHLRSLTGTPDLLDRLIAIDESWLKSYDPQDKKSAKRWRVDGTKP